MRRLVASALALGVVVAAGYAYASTPEPTTPQEWCRVVDLASGDEVTVPCHRDPTTTTTTTEAPTTTTTTTVEPTTTTQPPVSGDGFVETFDGNSGFDRFRRGVYHRDGHSGGTWLGDHDLACGGPDTTRTLDADNADDSFYTCRDHLMTSVGPVSMYSIAWFSPDQTFSDETVVSWDVNSTNLGPRQWVEIMLIPVDGPDLTCISWLPCGDDVRGYPSDAIVLAAIGQGKPTLTVGGDTNALTSKKLCKGDQAYVLDAEGCASKMIRRNWSITDNGDGTLTVRFLDNVWTQPGSFPDVPWKVVFKDHSYTPDKDGKPIGYTWHWDSVSVN